MIIELIQRVRVTIRLRGLFKGACVACFMFVSLTLIISLLDYFISFSSVIRLWLLYVIMTITAMAVIWFMIVPLLKKLTDDDISLIIQGKRPELSDDLINAVQLGKLRGRGDEWVSNELIDALVEKTTGRIASIRPVDVVVFPFRRYLIPNIVVFGIFILLVIMPPYIMKVSFSRLFNPMDYERISKLMKVLPGNVDVMSGRDLEVTADIEERRGRAYINYRFDKSGWKSMRMIAFKAVGETRAGRKYVHGFENLTGDLEYFVRWNDVQSPVYYVKVITLPEIGDITLVYSYPEYTGISEKKEVNTNGDIEAIYGTRVELTARSNKKIRKGFIITNDKKRFPMRIIKGNKLKGNLFLTGEEEYFISVEDVQGYTNKEPVKHRIIILQDEEPEVKIVAPDMDLVVSEKSVVDVVCEVKDDFGVEKVELVYQKSAVFGEEPDRITIKRFKPAVEIKMVNYEWKLGELNLRPGDIISYYLEVSDNDVISGPNKGVSRTFYIEVFSYEKEHAEIEEALEDFRDRLMNLLGDQIMAKDTMEKSKEEEEEEKLVDRIRSAKEKQEAIRESARDLTEIMEKLFTRMENDPLGDWRTYSEYRNITDHVRFLERGKMKQAVEEIADARLAEETEARNEKSDRAIKTQQEIIDELEKLALLSEDILQNQKMNDLMNVAHDITDKQADFARALEELMDKADTEKLKQLSKTLSEISELMEELNRALSEMPQELPEEFVNQDSIKDMDVGEMSDMMKELQKDIMNGDIDAALQKTRELLNMLSEMMDTLMEASSKVPSSDLDSLAQQTGDYMKELDEIMKEQEGIIDETARYDEKAMEELMKRQEEMLKELAALQKEVIERTNKMLGEVNKKLEYPGIRGRFSSKSGDSLRDMQSAYDDMAQPPARKARDYLRSVLAKLDVSRKYLDDITDKLKKEKDEKLEKLKNEKNEKGRKKEKKKKVEEEKKIIKAYSVKEKGLAEITDEFNFIYKTEKEILEKLEKSMKSSSQLLSKCDREKLKELAEKQQQLKQRADQLGQGLKKLSMKTSAIGPEILGNMKNGSAEMGKAGKALFEGETGQAVESEQAAFQYLAQGREGLKAAGKQLEQMMQQMGQGMQLGQGMPRFMRPGGGSLPGGRMGFREGKVRIPTAEDYLVPKEFRQDIMDALKENYPEIYKGLIKKYYKRLTE